MEQWKAEENIKKLSAKITEIECKATNEKRGLNKEEKGWIAEAQGAIEELKKWLPEKPLTLQDSNNRKDGHAARKDYKNMFGLGRSGLSTGGFKDASEFLRVIDSGRYDPRLDLLNAMGETTPSGGGFMVPTEFASEWLDASLPNEIVRPLCRVYPMTSESKDIPGWDSADMSDGSAYGGFKMEFLAESAQATGQTPKVRKITLQAKMASIYVNASLELTQDAKDFETNLEGALIKSIGYGIDRFCLSAAGTGAGTPQSIVNGACKIQISKESGQATDTLVYQNLKKMFARQLNPQNAVWLFNNNSIPELLEISIPVGLSGEVKPLLSESNGKFSIFGRPVYFHPSMPALGDEDSAAFVDFSFYGLGLRKEIWIDKSDAPRWDYRERSYRILMRFDAMPTLDKEVTPEHGDSLSSIITLGEI